jgi:hypothetical protein
MQPAPAFRRRCPHGFVARLLVGAPVAITALIEARERARDRRQFRCCGCGSGGRLRWPRRPHDLSWLREAEANARWAPGSHRLTRSAATTPANNGWRSSSRASRDPACKIATNDNITCIGDIEQAGGCAVRHARRCSTARQTGKSTLARQIAEARGGRYFTLDDPAVLALAHADPAALLRGFDGLTVIDEVQLAPALFRALKVEVDRDRRPGRFLLTGSASVFLLPRLSESLAGRLEVLPLWPLSQDELGRRPAHFVDRLFSRAPWRARRHAVDRLDVCRRIVAGGYPEVLERKAADRREAWFRSYLATLMQRDIRDLARIEGLIDLPRLLALLAARSSSLENVAEISRASGLAHSTLRRYLGLLEAVSAAPLPPGLQTPASGWCVRPRSISWIPVSRHTCAAKPMPTRCLARPRSGRCSKPSSCRNCAVSPDGVGWMRGCTTSALPPGAKWTS